MNKHRQPNQPPFPIPPPHEIYSLPPVLVNGWPRRTFSCKLSIRLQRLRVLITLWNVSLYVRAPLFRLSCIVHDRVVLGPIILLDCPNLRHLRLWSITWAYIIFVRFGFGFLYVHMHCIIAILWGSISQPIYIYRSGARTWHSFW